MRVYSGPVIPGSSGRYRLNGIRAHVCIEPADSNKEKPDRKLINNILLIYVDKYVDIIVLDGSVSLYTGRTTTTVGDTFDGP